MVSINKYREDKNGVNTNIGVGYFVTDKDGYMEEKAKEGKLEEQGRIWWDDA